MDKKKRKIYGVIAASVSDIEQREILAGIIARAQRNDIDIVVISNIYNPIEDLSFIEKENSIYDRIASPLFDGFIVIAESIANPTLQKKITEELEKRRDVPLIVLGTMTDGFDLPASRTINTSDENDIIDIVDHLVEEHGSRRIDILTGGSHIRASHKRIDGYRTALEKHGIVFDEHRVHFGDFWYPSGHALAKKYISGEIEYPDALLCCNDYMAYGVLDEFMEQGISVTDRMAVVGYEYVRERHAHTPLLTTYQRNRGSLGESAVDILMGKDIKSYRTSSGRLIHGETCGCRVRLADVRQEMTDIQTKETYEFYNLYGQLEQRLTECRNMTDFLSRCWEHQFMIREPARLYMCLYENWYDDTVNVDNMVRYNLLTYEKPAIFHKDDLCDFISGDPAPYYLCPLFFSDRELGYIVLRYDRPDTYDRIFRNWLKTIANGLEHLRIRNDIRYLSACQNLSEHHDSMTSMLNENGLKKAYQSADTGGMKLVMLSIGLFDGDFSAIRADETISAVLDAAEAVRQFCHKGDECASIWKTSFVCLVKRPYTGKFCTDLLTSILCQHPVYMERYGLDSYACAAVDCAGKTFEEAMKECSEAVQEEINRISARRRDSSYQIALDARRRIYSGDNGFDPDRIREGLKVSAGYLRILYKRVFGISFHQDCIAARIAKARYLLTVGDFSVQEVAFRCGYSDNKYFMRQFSQETGMTAKEFRSMVK